MSCGLTGMEVQILYILYRNKCFKTRAGYHSGKLKRILRKKFEKDSDIDSSGESIRGEKKNASALFDKAIANLSKRGCIAAIKKDDPKFYIADLGNVYGILNDHGLNVTPLGGDRIHHLD